MIGLTKNNIAYKFIHFLLSFLIVFNSILPGLPIVFAQEASSSGVTETLSPSPSIASTPLLTDKPRENSTLILQPILESTPSSSPSISPEISPTPNPLPNSSNESSPTAQTEQANIPSEISSSPSSTSEPSTYEPSPNVTLEQIAQGHMSVTVLENTSAQSLQLDLQLQEDISSASLTTNKVDYTPTDAVIISGADFLLNTHYKLIISSSDNPVVNSEAQVTTDNQGLFIHSYQLDGNYRPNYTVEVRDLNGNIVATTSFTDSITYTDSNDSSGANDEPGQKDLTRLGRDLISIDPLYIYWNWDMVSMSGNNTADACALFDTNNNGLANYSLCVTWNKSQNQVASSPTLYRCNDTKMDRCTGDVLITTPISSTCNITNTTDDPFPTGDSYPNDTKAVCSIPLSDVEGAHKANLLDVCSYPSVQPNSDPSDCIIIRSDKGNLTILKDVTPDDTNTNWNFTVSGPVNLNTSISGDGTSGINSVDLGTYSITETAGSNTNLSNYNTTWNCTKNGNTYLSGSGTTASNIGLGKSGNVEDSVICTFINTLNQGSLTVIKHVVGGTAVASDWTMHISSGSIQDIIPAFLGAENPGANNSLTTGSYTVTENNGPLGYSLSYSGDCDSSGNVIITAGQTKTCILTNTRDTGTLRVIKNVINNNGGTRLASDFILHVKQGLTDVIGSPTIGSATGTVYTLSTGSYTVSENTPPTGYTQTGFSGDCDSNGNVIVEAGIEKTCTITNNDNIPSLHLRKTVTNDNGGTALDTAWTLTATGIGGSPTNLSGTTPVDSGANFKTDTYTLAEVNGPSGFTAGAWNCVGGIMKDATYITIALGESATCTVNNDDIAPTLKLVKSVTNDSGGTADASAWTLTATGDSGFSDSGNSTTFHTVKADIAYALSESTIAGYDTGNWSCDGGSLSGSLLTLSLNQNVTCTITNHDQAAHLIIIKQVINNNGGTKTMGDFSGTITGVTALGGQDWVGTVSPGVNKTLTSVGNYDVLEIADPDYDTTYSEDCTGTIVLGQTKTCIVTNNDKPPSLTLNKIVINDNGGTAAESAWTLTATGPTPISGQGTSNHTDVVSGALFNQGTYTLSESGGPVGYSQSAWTCTNGVIVNGSNQISLNLGQSTICTITNNDQAGYIKIVKNTIGGNGTFGFAISGPTPSTPSVTTINGAGNTGLLSVNAGSYSVSETIPGDWNQTSASCDFGTPENFTVPNNGTVTCTFTNTKKGHLIVQKTTLPTIDTNFSITATGSGTITGGGTGTIANSIDKDYEVTPGIYSVSETVPADWDKTEDTCQNVVVAAGEIKTCTITNTKRGHIIIIKDAVPNNAQDFNFHNNFGNDNLDTFLLDDDSSVTLSDTRNFEVLPGIYSVSEDAVSDWKLSTITCVDPTENSASNLPAAPSATINVAAGETITCTFTNKKLGKIVINKGTIGGDGTFDFMMTGQSLPTTTQLTTLSGLATQTFTGIDPENTYTINEVVPSDWDLSNISCQNQTDNGNITSRDNSGFTISNGGTATCTFTNTKRGSITIIKDAVPNSPQDFSFRGSFDSFNLDDDNDDGLPNTQLLSNVIAGTYTITENTTPGWITESITCVDPTNDSFSKIISSDPTVSINLAAGENIICTFTNTQKGHLIVEKTTVPNGEINLFSITASGSGTITGGGNGTISDTLDQLYELTPGTYSVTESQLEGWDETGNNCSGIVIGAGETKTCTITNTKRGEILGTKYEVNSDGSLIGGLSDWIIRLFITGTQIDQTTTDPSGNFSFTNIVHGVYSLVENLPLSGWTQIFTPSQITLNPGQSSTDNNFGNFQNGSIQGVKFNDIDGNGQRCPFDNEEEESCEPTLSEWVIFIDENSNSILDEGEQNQETDAAGNYLFTNLGPSSYRVCEQEQTGWQRTKPVNSNCETVSLTYSNQTSALDFGNQGRGSITIDKVTNPSDVTQVFDFTLSGQASNSASLKDQDKPYTFDNLPAGFYTLSETEVDNWSFTNIDCGEDGNSNDTFIKLTLNAGESISCTITNTQDRGIIIVHKKVDDGSNIYQAGNSAANELGFRWSLDDGIEREMGASVSITTGKKHNISENSVPGYTFTGWYETGNENFSCTKPLSQDWPSLTVVKNLTRSITLCNKLQNPILTINKTNNKTGIDIAPGSSVMYTLTVEATQSAVKNVVVKDLLPDGFLYHSGSWTVNSNTRGALTSLVNEPIYASPGTWNIGNMEKDEKITLTLIADIDSSKQPGLYKDLAWAQGTSITSTQVLAKAQDPGFVDDNFVGTQVNIAKNPDGTAANIEKEEIRSEVLGASITMPVTGANTLWIILVIFLLAGGTGSIVLGQNLRRKND